jgi:hypothetical protein
MSEKHKIAYGVVSVLLLLCSSAIALVVERTRTLKPSTQDATRATTVKQKIQADIVTITPHGFEPRVIQRNSGPFLFVVENRSTFRSLTLRLYQGSIPAGPPMIETPFVREQLDWSSVQTLQPGVYVLTEAGHPTWTCVITAH